MITEQELQAVKLSPTNKDFYQIWQELLDTAGKISERWNPADTNEGDPGVVLLKVLTAVADKLNYNIDKNILEAFMPSAAQEQSMRKLCDMMGYNMKYFQSATTDVTITYIGEQTNLGDFKIPQFTTLTNTDNNVIYTTRKDAFLSINESGISQIRTSPVPCIEGRLIQCETNNYNNVILLNSLDDNFRYYLPELQIAENGIFIYNTNNGTRIGNPWSVVKNLNTVSAQQKVFKFCYDSKRMMPYIQFPDDVSVNIGDGLIIYYMRTNGINGNVSAKTLTKLVNSIKVQTKDGAEVELSAEDFLVQNPSAAKNGRNRENLTEAYNNFKKTVGTFDTLVTCRDYMNKIYNLFDTDANPYVSNIVVSDIRDDINSAYTLCEFSDIGIKYVTRAKPAKDITKDKISHFDLVLYPFKTVTGLNNEDEYVKSFQYTNEATLKISTELSQLKTISHEFKTPEAGDITCIKNYLRLNARITTTYKVNIIEQDAILNNIYTAIYTNFNARKVDFGEEIPYDSTLETIENADSRIKNVSLEEPILYTAVQTVNGDTNTITEYADTVNQDNYDFNAYLNKLILRNILAGKVALFNYNDKLKRNFDETRYGDYDAQYGDDDNKIKSITSAFTISNPSKAKDITLSEGEIVSYRAPNFKTVITYPAYVNYYLHRKAGIKTIDAPATFFTLENFLTGYFASDTPDTGVCIPSGATKGGKTLTPTVFKGLNTTGESVGNDFYIITQADIDGGATYSNDVWDRAIFVYDEQNGGYVVTGKGSFNKPGLRPKITNDSWSHWNASIKQITYAQLYSSAGSWPETLAGTKLAGIYREVDGANVTRPIGHLVDSAYRKYGIANQYHDYAYLFIQHVHTEDQLARDKSLTTRYTANGLGQNLELEGIANGTEYKLKPATVDSGKNTVISDPEYLLINYTTSVTTPSTDGKESTTSKVVIDKYYGPGTIIRPTLDEKVLHDTESKVSQAMATFTKTSEFDFSQYHTTDSSNAGLTNEPEGMLTLGVNEKIEIRDFAEVSLYDSENKNANQTVNVFWILQDNSYLDSEKKKFPFDNDSGTYTLKEGEMFYYTDDKKLSMLYYGQGCEIIKQGTWDLTRNSTDTKFSIEDVLKNGINAIPWISVSGLHSENKNITIKEYQYINLTDGDVVKNLGLSRFKGTELSATYIPCNGDEVEYRLSTSDKDASLTLPKLDLNLATEEPLWTVASKLQLNFDAEHNQTLRTTATTNEADPSLCDSITLNYYTDPTSSTPSMPKTLTPIANKNLSIKANRIIQSGNTETFVGTPVYKDGSLQTDYNLVIGVSEKTSAPTGVTFHNFGENGLWTQINFASLPTGTEKIPLNTNIPDDCFGLIMFYYSQKNKTTEVTNYIYLTVTKGSGELAIYNNVSSSDPANADADADSWWENYISKDLQYYLREGINIVKIPNTVTQITLHSDTSKQDSVIFGDLDCVYTNESRNKELNLAQIGYRIANSTDTVENIGVTLLSDLRKADPDHNFYYNAILDNSNVIDLGTSQQDNDRSDLSKPRILYDYNNMNNKFVISEISVDDMKKGIAIAQSSKL